MIMFVVDPTNWYGSAQEFTIYIVQDFQTHTFLWTGRWLGFVSKNIARFFLFFSWILDKMNEISGFVNSTYHYNNKLQVIYSIDIQ